MTVEIPLHLRYQAAQLVSQPHLVRQFNSIKVPAPRVQIQCSDAKIVDPLDQFSMLWSRLHQDTIWPYLKRDQIPAQVLTTPEMHLANYDNWLSLAQQPSETWFYPLSNFEAQAIETDVVWKQPNMKFNVPVAVVTLGGYQLVQWITVLVTLWACWRMIKSLLSVFSKSQQQQSQWNRMISHLQ
jgi:hypothetical protein